MKSFARIALLLLALATCAFADRLILKDGRSFEGDILEQTDAGVKIKTNKATLFFAADLIASVEKGTSPMQERSNRLEALEPDSPEKYVELAEWMLDAGKDVADAKIIRKVCNIAASLDPALAARAQLTLGKYLLARKEREDAATAFARALAAEAENEEAKKLLGTLSEERAAAARKQLQQLKEAVGAMADLKYKDALPKLRKVLKFYFADKCRDYTGMTIEQMEHDAQRRVPCEACKGRPLIPCKRCGGTGLLKCEKCEGTGKKKKVPAKPTFLTEVCTDCYHMGWRLCADCAAERTITINWSREVEGRMKLEIPLKGDNEWEVISKYVNMKTWARKKDGVTVTQIDGGPVKGGTAICKVCNGVLFDPPDKEVDTFKIREYMAAMDERITGKVAIETLGPADSVYDPAEVFDHKFRWKDGKWVE